MLRTATPIRQGQTPDRQPRSMNSTVSESPDLADQVERLEAMNAPERIQWAITHCEERLILTSSFGAQAAVCLHLATKMLPNIPIVLIDTGYLFPETYRFIDLLSEKLRLNLKIFRSPVSPAWQEARWGKLWEQGNRGIEEYNRINKVLPMKQALETLQPRGWLAGLRRAQSQSRSTVPVMVKDGDCMKIHPIIDWSDRQVHEYLSANNLPYHPLWHQNYLTIGDTHTTRRVDGDVSEEQARFFGLKRECGIHEGINPNYSI